MKNSRYLNTIHKTRPLGKMIRDVYKHLRASVWLPYPEDYAVLALTVPVTYVQAAFDAVPLFIVNGPAGSGKSQLGIAMSQGLRPEPSIFTGLMVPIFQKRVSALIPTKPCWIPMPRL